MSKKIGDNGPTPKHRPPPPPNPTTIIRTNRQVIENKLLAALDDKDKVAALITKQDLEDLIFHIRRSVSLNDWDSERKLRAYSMAEDFQTLLDRAFGE